MRRLDDCFRTKKIENTRVVKPRFTVRKNKNEHQKYDEPLGKLIK